MMRAVVLTLLVSALALAGEAAYRRGALLWSCDFTADEVKALRKAGSDMMPFWQANEGAKGDGALHFKSTGGSALTKLKVPRKPFAGIVQIEADVKGVDVCRGSTRYHGPKVMFSHMVGGKRKHPQMDAEFGTWDWKTWIRLEAFGEGSAPPEHFTLGIEQAAGEFWIDALRVYATEEVPDAAVSVAPPNPQADKIPRGPYFGRRRPGGFRGVMSPGRHHFITADDIATLHAWKANLLRLQIQVDRKKVACEEDFDRLLAERLTDVDRVLGHCRRYGIKVVLDLHTPPGTRKNKHAGNMIPADYDTAPLRRAWRTIASRYSGDPILYGYDILNEPGCAPDVWDRIFRETVAEIRRIDAKTPVLCYFLTTYYPEEMNVIYSPHCYEPHTLTHLGVGAPPGTDVVRWSYGNYVNGVFWNADQLRVGYYNRGILQFRLAHPKARMYLGEFSCIAWTKGAADYIRDAIALCEEYDIDWTYHAFREAPIWDVEYESPDGVPDAGRLVKATKDTDRKKALLQGLSLNEVGK